MNNYKEFREELFHAIEREKSIELGLDRETKEFGKCQEIECENCKFESNDCYKTREKWLRDKVKGRSWI